MADSKKPFKSSSVLTQLAIICLIFSMVVARGIYNCNTVASSTGGVNEGLLKIGDSPTFCIHFLPFQIKIGFKVTVDTNVALSVRNGFEAVKAHNTDIAVQLSNSEKLSQQIVR